MPGWYAATFKAPSCDQPLFLTIKQARKGQIFLNGHNVGRFWSVGPQASYYLPNCWMRDVNELRIFEENGIAPTGSKLQLKPFGPYRTE